MNWSACPGLDARERTDRWERRAGVGGTLTFILPSTRHDTTAARCNVPPCSPCGCELLLAHVNDPEGLTGTLSGTRVAEFRKSSKRHWLVMQPVAARHAGSKRPRALTQGKPSQESSLHN